MNSTLPHSIDIDVGGTFTDCFIQCRDQRTGTKSPTTSFDLWVGFFRALNDAARQLGMELNTLLRQTNIIRYSTTLAMNKLLERKGPKLGLITTEGFEDLTLIGKGAQWADGLSKVERQNLALVTKPSPLIPRERIVGLKERMDHSGEVLRPLDEDDLRMKLGALVDHGIQGIVVSLLWAHRNPVHEIRVREIIEEEYPESCLGHISILLSHEIQPKKGEYQRTITAVLNAYLHESMAEDLGSIRGELKDMGYEGPLLMVHNSGGMAELSKTRAIDTFNGGPIAGIVGSLQMAKLYGFDNVITTDMGGTSFDLGVITEGQSHFFEMRPIIDRWMVNITMLESKSIGAGGGSIAWVNRTMGGKLQVGPHSAGSMPGPACYNLGGVEPTVTDADVVLGYINPAFFHGGKIELDRELAVRAIRDKIARPLELDVEEAAVSMRKLVDGNMGNIIFKETVLRGHDPREFILFSFGGAGPTHCCGYALAGQIRRLIAFPFSPVFCAFSGSLMDIRHIYELSRRLIILRPGDDHPVLDRDDFNGTVERLVGEAIDNAMAEGLNPDRLMFRLELDMKYGGQLHPKRTRSPGLKLKSEKDISSLLNAFAREYSRSFSPVGVYPEGGVSIETFVLHAILPSKVTSFPTFTVYSSKPPRTARKGSRMVFWEEAGGYRTTPIYDYRMLRCGNILDGPAVVEADHTTFVLPGHARLHIDKYMNNVIELLE
jgi:N-methylhydantoinase A/oxoprolinase/acetone carboxylase beta subunit